MRWPQLILALCMFCASGWAAAAALDQHDGVTAQKPREASQRPPENKSAPLNLSYVLIAGGAVLIVIGGIIGRSR